MESKATGFFRGSSGVPNHNLVKTLVIFVPWKPVKLVPLSWVFLVFEDLSFVKLKIYVPL